MKILFVWLIVLLAKSLAVLSRWLKKGSGTALPGLIVEKYAKWVVGELAKFYQEVIFISGTNGKTTTRALLVQIYEQNGVEVCTNRGGANIFRGIASSLMQNTKWNLQPKFSTAILEIEEATLPILTEYIQPTKLILTNIFRDQLDAYGEIDKTVNFFRQALAKSDPVVYINSDDQKLLTCLIGFQGQVVGFGVETDNKPKYESSSICQTDFTINYLAKDLNTFDSKRVFRIQTTKNVGQQSLKLYVQNEVKNCKSPTKYKRVAHGIIYNPRVKKILVIQPEQNQKSFLSVGGIVEEGENYQEGWLREVYEETGLLPEELNFVQPCFASSFTFENHSRQNFMTDGIFYYAETDKTVVHGSDEGEPIWLEPGEIELNWRCFYPNFQNFYDWLFAKSLLQKAISTKGQSYPLEKSPYWYGADGLQITTQLTGVYNLYNVLSAAIVGYESFGENVLVPIANFQPVFGRGEQIWLNQTKLKLFLIKNPAGFEQVLKDIQSTKHNQAIKMVLLINDNIADGKDVSWLWDVDLEQFIQSQTIDSIKTAGTRGLDMLLRLEYAWAKVEPADYFNSVATLVKFLQNQEGEWFILSTYTATLSLRQELGKYINLDNIASKGN